MVHPCCPVPALLSRRAGGFFRHAHPLSASLASAGGSTRGLVFLALVVLSTAAPFTFPFRAGMHPVSALNPSASPSSLPTAFSSAPHSAVASLASFRTLTSLPHASHSLPVAPHRMTPQSPDRLPPAFVASEVSAFASRADASGAATSQTASSASSRLSASVASSGAAGIAAFQPPRIPVFRDLPTFSASVLSSAAARGTDRACSARLPVSLNAAAGAGKEGDTGVFSFPGRECLSPQQQHRELVSPYVGQMLLEDMLVGRMLEDACARLYYMGKTAGFVHLYTGQEAVSSGVIKLLRRDDAVVSTYRDHVHATSKGVPVREVMAELFGKATGCSKGRGGSMHMFSKPHNMIGGFAFIGEQIPVALGYAFSAAYRRFAMGDKNDPNADQVTVCFLGDGTTNMGQLYEALNIAALSKLPIVFVVENNNWAIGMAAQRSTAIPAVWQRAESFGVAGVEVDGMDVLAVRGAARRAIDRARRGEGPTLIEALTYRFRGHSVADPDEMRAVKQKEAWVVRDPIKSFEEELKRLGYATDETIAATRAKVKALVDDAVKFAETSPDPDVQECGQFIFAPPYADAGKPEPMTKEQLHEYAVALKQELDFKARVRAGDKTPQPSALQNPNPPVVID
ncbi:pyruvate dehydrogenase complex subunit PDH-E1Alpha [Besnoitia besnoiti]|uniref:Pyruvate dehydrogenase E1 component subunit alpha n=1 Tax=Besnoitia besnoiti TaxID=94643 RepID=A0A2A9MK89_BESBE|nr:pyruvate dehydrogenase complex subunit PDH-E1Alpha [Besnoitia besnoiti]PFH38339.1 pyruvate dehydrogenase complex subunit PDH-E1Alpha [Besnoitia besnoiti]